MKNRSFFKKYSVILAMTATLAVLFLLKACTKEQEPIGIITMTTQASEVRIAGEVIGDISIDWGDGKKSNVNDAYLYDDFKWSVFNHDYSSTTEHNIVISGNVTKLYCRSSQLIALDVSRSRALTDLDCSSNQLTTLDVSKNAALKQLQCNWNHLTRLDVSKNKALNILSCIGNFFSVSALNDLFGTLPDYSKTDNVAAIYISLRNPNAVSNPATLYCDRSIAEKRGWHFRTKR